VSNNAAGGVGVGGVGVGGVGVDGTASIGRITVGTVTVGSGYGYTGILHRRWPFWCRRWSAASEVQASEASDCSL
jgi:hypothetical protein